MEGKASLQGISEEKKEGKPVFDGFLKVAAMTPKGRVADCAYNTEQICKMIDEAVKNGAKIVVFPELCITGYTCGDLFWQECLLEQAKHELHKVIFHSKEKDALIFVGLPWEKDGKLYNVAAAVCHGKLLGLVPKKNLPNYAEFYEARNFEPGNETVEWTEYEGKPVPFGTKQIFCCREMEGLKVAAEICEDLWVANPPSIGHALAGATVVVNLSASDECTGKNRYREALIAGQSARLLCAYVYANAGEGESTTDLVFAGQNVVAENGVILKKAKSHEEHEVYALLDLNRLRSERRRITTFHTDNSGYEKIAFSLEMEEVKLERYFDPAPFVPHDEAMRTQRCEEILTIQALGLKKRLEHTHAKNAVVGISGGLDSTLALLVTAKAFDLLDMDRANILAVTMPCFGTTDRTYTNACEMARRLGATLKEVDIKNAVHQHFSDIGQDFEKHDVTFENSQARERTQVLMDLANQNGGMVIGTGDMSELALGWATYNGDHMSMYGVNASVPKTLVRHLVRYYADTCEDQKLSEILLDVLDTPVSPELLPPKDGEIAQKTEDLVGPYELHDFFLYYVLRFGYDPAKIYRVAKKAFEDLYDEETILKWLRTFYRRFFAQQFKRSCLPDGPKVGSVAVSPRGDLRMPSDACAKVWLDQLAELEVNNG